MERFCYHTVTVCREVQIKYEITVHFDLHRKKGANLFNGTGLKIYLVVHQCRGGDRHCLVFCWYIVVLVFGF